MSSERGAALLSVESDNAKDTRDPSPGRKAGSFAGEEGNEMREGLLQENGGDKRADWSLPPPVSKSAERAHAPVGFSGSPMFCDLLLTSLAPNEICSQQLLPSSHSTGSARSPWCS
jgi:hypothetical protein